jgi:4-amino-4-deoxy-L-arabinose transferase-like glycosyltransferase
MPDRAVDRRSLVLVFVVALACRGALFAATASDPSRLLAPPDSGEYLTIAENLNSGHGFSADTAPPYRPDVRRTPLYPLMLAGVFRLPLGGVRLASLLGVVAGATAAAALYCLAWRLFGPEPALIAGLLLAVDVTSISYSVLILTEAIFTCLLIAAILMLVTRPRRLGRAGLGGVLLGCATLCRPAGFLLAPASLPACAWRPARRGDLWRDYVSVNAVFAAIALAWIVRNSIVAGAPTLSSIGPVNLYFYRAAAVEAYVEGKDADAVRAAWEARFAQLSDRWTESEKIAWMTGQARDVIGRHPAAYARIALDGVRSMATSEVYELRRMFGGESPVRRALDSITRLQLWFVYPAALVGFVAAASNAERRRALLVPATFIAYFVLVSGPEAYSRFRVPAMPFVAMLGGVGLSWLHMWMQRDRQ